MRHLIALAFAAALAGCSVDVEGAACDTPGSPDNCPAGQACGAGRTCSVAAAGCAPCRPGDLKCDVDGDVKACSAASDPACGDWTTVQLDCAAGVRACAAPVAGGAFECRCERFVVDPAAPSAGTCHFASVAEAVAEARRFGVAEVWLGGPSGQVYGVDAADAATLVIPPGMKVAGDDSPAAPGTRFLEAKGAGSEAVRLEAGATLAGVTVRRGAGGPTLGVRLVGDTPPSQTTVLQLVQVQGGAGGAFATGVRVEGSGAVALDRLTVRGPTVSGLEVARAAGSDTVTAFELLVDGEATGPAVPPAAPFGVGLFSGDLAMTRAEVKRSAGAGVMASGSGAAARLTFDLGSIHDNFGTGLVAQLLGKLSVSGAKVCRNKGGAARNINGTFRLVGGMFVGGAVPGEQLFTGNRFFDNDGDQVGIGPGAGVWNLAGPSAPGEACGGGVNAFAGYATAGGAYGLVTNANVIVSWDAWPNSLPVLGVDVLRIGAPTVVLGTEGVDSNFCSLPSDLVCPTP